ncbi:hypothetical protein ACSBR1_004379 [Camellia fascicularis]
MRDSAKNNTSSLKSSLEIQTRVLIRGSQRKKIIGDFNWKGVFNHGDRVCVAISTIPCGSLPLKEPAFGRGCITSDP